LRFIRAFSNFPLLANARTSSLCVSGLFEPLIAPFKALVSSGKDGLMRDGSRSATRVAPVLLVWRSGRRPLLAIR